MKKCIALLLVVAACILFCHKKQDQGSNPVPASHTTDKWEDPYGNGFGLRILVV